MTEEKKNDVTQNTDRKSCEGILGHLDDNSRASIMIAAKLAGFTPEEFMSKWISLGVILTQTIGNLSERNQFELMLSNGDLTYRFKTLLFPRV